MNEQQKAGIIALIVVLSVAGLGIVLLNISFFKDMFSDFFKHILLMIIYAAIPCVPAVILRAKFGLRSLKWIAFAATVAGGLCCLIHIILPDAILEERVVVYEDPGVIIYEYVNEWIFTVTQCVLTSSVPVLYCVAFTGNLYSPPFVFKKERSLLVALVPSLMFLLSLFIRQVITKGLSDTFEFILDETIFMTVLSSAVFAVWALIMIFISLMIYRFLNRMKIKEGEII